MVFFLSFVLCMQKKREAMQHEGNESNNKEVLRESFSGGSSTIQLQQSGLMALAEMGMALAEMGVAQMQKFPQQVMMLVGHPKGNLQTYTSNCKPFLVMGDKNNNDFQGHVPYYLEGIEYPFPFLQKFDCRMTLHSPLLSSIVQHRVQSMPGFSSTCEYFSFICGQASHLGIFLRPHWRKKKKKLITCLDQCCLLKQVFFFFVRMQDDETSSLFFLLKISLFFLFFYLFVSSEVEEVTFGWSPIKIGVCPTIFRRFGLKCTVNMSRKAVPSMAL